MRGIALLLVAILWAALGHFVVGADTVQRWGCFELALTGPATGNPYLDVQWWAVFRQGDVKIRVPGFWDGGDTYKLRFSPPTLGQWRYQTHSTTPELDGKTGVLEVVAPTGNNHGPVEVFNTYYFRYADGTPYHQFGTTCYAWIHQPRALQEQTLRTLASAPFNKIRFCVFPKSYAYNQNEPELFAFQRRPDGKFDFARPDVRFWRHLEQRILDLQRLGVEADLILWHPYDRWGFSEMGAANDDRYLRYCIARLSALRNVWWSLANEYDLMAPGAMRGHRGDKQMADWDRFFQILQKEDPHQRLRSIHNCRQFYDHKKPWVTHASIQSHDLPRVFRWRGEYARPIIVDECGYEGNIPQGWGNLSPQEMVRRFWLGTMCGGYVGHGETYKHPEDILWWSKGGVLHGQSPARIAWLRQFMAQLPPFDQLQPAEPAQGRFMLAKSGQFYLVYCTVAGTHTVELAGDKPYKLDLIDPWEMTIAAIGNAQPGQAKLHAPKANVAFRLQVYQPGEPLRPEPKIEASVTEGVAPLSVKFSGSGGEKLHWDFGDGTSATGPSAAHVYSKPGVYTVTLTAHSAERQGRSFVDIVVDRSVMEPLVRAGFLQNESAALKLQGSARRGQDGAFHLPDGPPWGWVEVAESPIEDIRGLQSFTILGWLKPESLKTGAGGNRILFCLNKDHSGIDLVCHADGRLRLAVNQWPDNVKCDSSPGKLQVGKWTFFAVTYHAKRSSDNVSWYFSSPLDAPGQADVKLDRHSTYSAGAVGVDVGPLCIGNFNPTMRSYGMDRQFRGQIRGLQVFGSRLADRGALDLQTIVKHM